MIRIRGRGRIIWFKNGNWSKWEIFWIIRWNSGKRKERSRKPRGVVHPRITTAREGLLVSYRTAGEEDSTRNYHGGLYSRCDTTRICWFRRTSVCMALHWLPYNPLALLDGIIADPQLPLQGFLHGRLFKNLSMIVSSPQPWMLPRILGTTWTFHGLL